jgi:hypothetical protein
LIQLDLATGVLLKTHALPPAGWGMVKTSEHLTLMGMGFDSHCKNDQQCWLYSFHKSSDQPYKTSISNIEFIEPLASLQSNKIAAFLGDYRSVIQFSPEDESISIENNFEEGVIRVIAGSLMTIDGYSSSSQKGKITLYKNGNVTTTKALEAIEFPRVKSVGQKIFYKQAEMCFVGYDLENDLPCLQCAVPAESFSKRFKGAEINGQLWLFDCDKDSLQAYILNGPLLMMQWCYKIESKRTLGFMCDTLRFSIDRTLKKVWGLSEGRQAYRWDINTGQLEYMEDLSFGKDAKIIAFHPNGAPIVHTTDAS